MMQSWLGFGALADTSTIVAILAGSLLGITVGVLPGLGPGVAIAVMLPLTYGMPPLPGIALLLGVYVAAFYGGAVTSILIRTPGEASSIMTMFDGYPMAQRGEAERALSLAFSSAFTGGLFSALVLAVLMAPVATFTSRFGSAENATAALLATIFVARAYERQFPAAIMMVGLGFLIGTVGIDATSAEQRFTFGFPQLQNGLPLVPVVIGVFGIAQALVLISSPTANITIPQEISKGASIRHFLEPFRYPKTLIKSLLIGTSIGVLPAVGAALSTTLAYFEAKRTSSDPDTFGQGAPEGIVAAEAANNSNSGGAMLTVLTLGIPGDAITAIIMGVFVIHGIVPGPMLLDDKPELVFGIFAALIAINVATVVMLLILVRHFARLSLVDPRWIGIAVLALSFIGAYSTANSFYNVWVAIIAGLFGWLCAIARIPVVPLVLGLVIGDMLEASLRQALTVSDGSLAIFVTRPIAAVLMFFCFLALAQPLLTKVKGTGQRRQVTR